MAQLPDLLVGSLESFAAGLVAAIPRLLGGALFLVLAYVAIKIVTTVLRSVLSRTTPADQGLVVDLAVLIASIFLWFGAGLALLNVVGLGELAASLGTAVGFIALGVSYALSEMIEDTVAGVYLLKDPDFNPGDTVTMGAGTGVVVDIGLRKSRFDLESGDRLIVANRDVETKWTKKSDENAADGETADGTTAD
ncbi:mechanosensitive ion channel domain-containing protein [Halorientalis halophila]|uniref:mechanosensitive ion channel domain-containing protein n=1 Tax=Halorientalis halophila TaxID=3108499 RepID=UPI00300A8744